MGLVPQLENASFRAQRPACSLHPGHTQLAPPFVLLTGRMRLKPPGPPIACCEALEEGVRYVCSPEGVGQELPSHFTDEQAEALAQESGGGLSSGPSPSSRFSELLGRRHHREELKS